MVAGGRSRASPAEGRHGPARDGHGGGWGWAPRAGGRGPGRGGEGWGKRTHPNRRCTNCRGGPAARAPRHPWGGAGAASPRWAGPPREARRGRRRGLAAACAGCDANTQRRAGLRREVDGVTAGGWVGWALPKEREGLWKVTTLCRREGERPLCLPTAHAAPSRCARRLAPVSQTKKLGPGCGLVKVTQLEQEREPGLQPLLRRIPDSEKKGNNRS